MTPLNSSIPNLAYQPPTVDFIDNRLPRYHSMFMNPPVHFSGTSGQYVLNGPSPGPNTVGGVGGNAPLRDFQIPARPAWTTTRVMDFWKRLFPEAMISFQQTNSPKGRDTTVYNIRDESDWDGVYEKLQMAQERYQADAGVMGKLRKVRRKAADHIVPFAGTAQIASKLAPPDTVATPVLGALVVLLDAVKSAAKVRNQVLQGFDGLIPIFADVELFLGTFDGDENIRKAAIDLTVTALEAIERAIGFFISDDFRRGAKSIFRGEEYEKGLLDSIEMIQTKSRSLMEEATKSHIHETHMYSQETQKLHKQWLSGQEQTLDGINSLNRLLEDHLAQKDRELNAARQENANLRVENGILRANSPFQYPWSPPPAYSNPPKTYVSPEALRRILDTPDCDVADTAFVSDRKEQLPSTQRVQAEQIIHSHHFQRWIVSPSSTKLLVHWDLRGPRMIAGVSPLSVFCTTMRQTLNAQKRFISILWLCGQHTESTDGFVGGRAMLISLVDQLLRQYPFDTQLLDYEVDLSRIQDNNLDELIKLLTWLTRQLPETITLFCLVDGVVFCERDEFQEEALPVLSSLLLLVGDQTINATVKVLFTSTPGTDIVRGSFEDEDLILNVDTLPRMVMPANEDRMAREFDRSYID